MPILHVRLTKLQLIIMLSASNGFLSGCGYNSVSLKGKKESPKHCLM